MEDSENTAPIVPVLLVDDRPANLVALRAILEAPDYRLVDATSGEEALARTLDEDFAVILLDVSMPGMGGFEVADYLKRREKTRHTPILFVTALATDIAQIYEAYSLGAVDYLIKPLDERVVRAKVSVFAELYRQRQENERQAARLREHDRREHALRLSELRVALDQRYRKLVEGIDHAIAWTAEPDTFRLTFVSRQAPRLLGYPEEDFTAPDFWHRRLHPEDRDQFFERTREALVAKDDQMVDHRLVKADGEVGWYHTGMSFEPADAQNPAAMHGISVDVTLLKRMEQVQRFLAGLANLLAEPLERREALKRLADAVVVELADWCWLELLDGNDAAPTATVAHRDPSAAALAAEIEPRLRAERGRHEVIARVLRTGGSAIYPGLTDDSRDAPELGPEHPEALRAVGARSYMIVRLRAREKTLGTMTFVSTQARRRFDAADLALASDLADRAALAADNIRLYEEARSATRARDGLLAVVSHDLRNPLNTIAISASCLRELMPTELEGDATVTRAFDAIDRAAEGMARLLDDLIDLERIELKRLHIEKRPRKVGALIEELEDLLGPLARAKSLELRVEAEGVGDQTVVCDGGRVLQVFSNLVGNALKFSPPGHPVTVRAERADDVMRFFVIDEGPGLSADARAHVFDRFWQSDAGATEGLGLGLAIAKSIVELHGGEIGVDSAPGRGTRFCFTLPVVDDATAPSASAE